LSVRARRERAEMPRPARMLAPGRKIHHGAWGGHFAFSGNAWQRLQSSGARLCIVWDDVCCARAALPDT
jgi:hypothetical protein